MWKYGIAILDRIAVVIGALLFAQAPHFIEQYLHRLGGHIAELNYQVKAIHLAAESSGKTIQEYLQKFLANGDPDIQVQGEFLQNMITRLSEFSHSFTLLQNSTLFTKPVIFLKNFHPAIVSDTYKYFKPGFSFSTETLAYSFVGMVVGYVIFTLLLRLFQVFPLKTSR